VKGVIIDPKPVIDVLEKFGKDDSIKAVVLRIDTPGAAWGPPRRSTRRFQWLRTKKTVVASMGSMATSGGYYVACGPRNHCQSGVAHGQHRRDHALYQRGGSVQKRWGSVLP